MTEEVKGMSDQQKPIMPAGRQTKDFAFDVKAISPEGTIEGYASVFDVVDSEGDIVVPGAFTRTLGSWKSRGRKVPVLWQHDAYNSIGVTEFIEQDDRGLHVISQLLMDVQSAREAHARASAGAVGGLSIGFTVPAKAADGNPAVYWDDDRDARVFREVNLWEYSLVTFPANEHATIQTVKFDAEWAADLTAAVRELRETVATHEQRDQREMVALLTDLRDIMKRLRVRPSDGGASRTTHAGARPPDGGAPRRSASGIARPSDGGMPSFDPGLQSVLAEARMLLGARSAPEGGRNARGAQGPGA